MLRVIWIFRKEKLTAVNHQNGTQRKGTEVRRRRENNKNSPSLRLCGNSNKNPAPPHPGFIRF